MKLSEIPKVIYAPRSAFKEIAENPKYFATIIVIVLLILATLGSVYARTSNVYLQQTAPSMTDPYNPDPWTENVTMWTSSAAIRQNDTDVVYGFYSLQFDISNASFLQMKLEGIGSINLSDGIFDNVTFGMKMTQPTGIAPENGTFYLFSGSTPEDFFYTTVEGATQISSSQWTNFTIPVGAESGNWVNSTEQANWSNITALSISLTWTEPTDLEVLVDKLFFQSSRYGPVFVLTAAQAVYIGINTVSTFVIAWVIFSAAMYIWMRLFHMQSKFKMFMVIVSYSFMGLIITKLLVSVVYPFLPPLYQTTQGLIPEAAHQTVVIFDYLSILVLPLWSMILSYIGAKQAFNLSTGKSIGVAVIGYLPYYVLLFLLPSLIVPLAL